MLEDRILHILPIYGGYGEFAKILDCSVAGVRQSLDRLIASGRVRRAFDDKGRPVYERGIEQTVPQLLARIAELEAQVKALEAERVALRDEQLALHKHLLALLHHPTPIQEQPPAQLPQGFTPTHKPAPMPAPATHNTPSVDALLAEWEE